MTFWDYLPLIGILIVIVGFALKWNSIAIVVIAMVVTGLLGRMTPMAILNTIGTSFLSNRSMATFLIILPVVGLLERNGLKETAAKLIQKIKQATPGAVITAYGVLRALLASFNVGLGGVAGFVRPVVYPMAVGSVENKGSKISEEDDEAIKGMASSAENVTWFFGQVLFAGGSGYLLVKGALEPAGYPTDAAKAVAAELPVLICACIVAFVYYNIVSAKMMKKYKNTK